MNTETKSFNYGLAILRMLMCFEVVLCHFWSGDVPLYLKPFELLQGLAVPVFFFLSFFLSYNLYLQNDNEKAKKRFWRLFWPLIGWAIIYFICFFSAELIFPEIKDLWGEVKIKDLFWQIFTGNSPVLNPTMWFQFDLIIITFIFFIIFKKLDLNKALITIFIVLLISIIFQYTGLNLFLFGALKYEISNPLGRICEMIPYAVLGFSCAYFKIFDYFEKKKILFFILCPIIVIFLLNYSIINTAPGFGYSNNNNILIAFFITLFAYYISFENASDKIKSIIKFITKYTMGIYCMHRLVALGIKFFLVKFNVDFNTFILALSAYVVSFIISFLISKIPVKLFRELVD